MDPRSGAGAGQWRRPVTPTDRILDFASAPHRLPAQVRADTLRLLADTLAVGAAGVGSPGAEAVRRVARAWGRGHAARVIGLRERLPAMGAAYANGFAIHGLEWDAVHEGAVVHALSAVVPAVMAAIDQKGGHDAEDALTAIAVGVDIAAGLGLAASGPLTFFRPGIAGIYGAAIAVARIHAVPPGRFADILGMAHAHAAGTMQAHAEGSIALPLQFANAARGAIHAVDLVMAGLSAPHDVLSGPFGHFRLFDAGDAATYANSIGSRWLVSDVSTKPFPCGRASHAVLGALTEFHGRQVATVEAHVPPLIHHLVGRPMRADMTPAYARLCLPFLAALMLNEGRIDPRQFTANIFADPAMAAAAERFTLVDDGNGDPNALSPQRLVVTLADGTVEHIAVPATLGSPDAPLSPAQVGAKITLCRTLAGPDGDPRLFDDPIAYLTEPR